RLLPGTRDGRLGRQPAGSAPRNRDRRQRRCCLVESGWGNKAVSPLPSVADAALLSLGGATPTTLRFEDESWDADYIMLVSTAPGLQITSVSVSGGSVTVKWTGAGTLETATSLTPPTTWTPTGNASGQF